MRRTALVVVVVVLVVAGGVAFAAFHLGSEDRSETPSGTAVAVIARKTNITRSLGKTGICYDCEHRGVAAAAV